MTERERYRTRGLPLLPDRRLPKCVEEYGALLDRYPADTGRTRISASAWCTCTTYRRHLEVSRRAVTILPKRAIYHSNLAMDLVYSGDFPAAAKEAAETVKLGYVNGYLIQAFIEPWHKSSRPRPPKPTIIWKRRIPSDAATGLADLGGVRRPLFGCRQDSRKGHRRTTWVADKPDKDAAATKYWMLAHVQLLRKQNAAALAAAKLALENNQAFQTRLVAGQVYAALGEEAKARELATGLANELQIEPQAYAKLIEGEIALKNGDGRGAVKTFHGSQQAAGYLDRPVRPGPGLSGDRALSRRRFRIRPVHQTPRRGGLAVRGSADLRLLSARLLLSGTRARGHEDSGFRRLV